MSFSPAIDHTSRFPSFENVRPCETHFTCIHPAKSKDFQRCTQVINSSDRALASQLKSIILAGQPATEELQWNLKRFAELCCCKQAHRKTAKEMGRLDNVACKWLHELVGGLNLASPPNYSLPPPQRFLPYVPRGERDDLYHALRSPLGQGDFADGTLYMLRRDDDPGFLKIGYTKQIADVRFAFLQSECGFDPVPIRQIRRVACVRRVERLIHAELIDCRKESTACAGNPNCETLHSEWFEEEQDRGENVMYNWARWMTDANPYEATGELKLFWANVLVSLIKSSQPLTGKVMMEVLREKEAKEALLVKAFSSLHIGRKQLHISTTCEQ